jgi:hypothetical protein
MNIAIGTIQINHIKGLPDSPSKRLSGEKSSVKFNYLRAISTKLMDFVFDQGQLAKFQRNCASGKQLESAFYIA